MSKQNPKRLGEPRRRYPPSIRRYNFSNPEKSYTRCNAESCLYATLEEDIAFIHLKRGVLSWKANLVLKGFLSLSCRKALDEKSNHGEFAAFLLREEIFCLIDRHFLSIADRGSKIFKALIKSRDYSICKFSGPKI